ncbi:MAG TPA: ribosome maturation factor RimM, partial [Lichenihabitans sp.]|nr:ribosome maturation factor RimM [Lichenihabitans sp.]
MTTEGMTILVGVFGAAQGIKGEIRIKSFTADPKAIAAYGPLMAPDGRIFRLLAVRPLKDDMLVARVEDISTRSEAELLTGVELFIDRSRLPAPDDEEFYHADLIGLAAELTDGRVLGTIRAVENFGGGDLLDIVPP